MDRLAVAVKSIKGQLRIRSAGLGLNGRTQCSVWEMAHQS